IIASPKFKWLLFIYYLLKHEKEIKQGQKMESDSICCGFLVHSGPSPTLPVYILF
ncbi:hypothetical protein ACJX0J_034779, partial [Zea mays]